jgi:putative oxidoreductase
MSMNDRPKLIVPQLKEFYASVDALWYPMIRIVTGAILFMHGWAKLKVGVVGVTGYFAKNGFEPAVFFAYSAIFLETVGALCVVVGLFTRFFAAALAIELGVAMFAVHFSKGFNASQGGYEYVLLLGVIMFAVALRGGGPYSLDHKIGWQL